MIDSAPFRKRKANNINTHQQNTKEIIEYPFISNKIARECSSNLELYPIVYLFENSIRNMIEKVLLTDYGLDWWNLTIVKDIPTIDRDVNLRILDENNKPWHSKRGVHKIYYTDINDLEKILDRYGNVFSKYCGGKKNIRRIIGWIIDIEQTRNIIAHNNPVKKADIKRLMQYATDWKKLALEIEKNCNRNLTVTTIEDNSFDLLLPAYKHDHIIN